MTRPRLAVFKFASCDGCQLSLLAAERELLALAERVEIAYFLEARSQALAGPYDVALVEGSITTPHDAQRIRQIRQESRFLVTIGACATAGGIQALRNWANVDEFVSQIYATPEYISTLATSTAIGDHVKVDFELRGCPINTRQAVDLISAVLLGRKPSVPHYSVCMECKRRGTVCVAVAQGIACVGPVTQAGCGALCPAHDRGCYGCYGPKETTNVVSLTNFYRDRGERREDLIPLLRNFNGYAPEFREATDRLESENA
jgi:coenzyme F420-reducing hydrogenase gamma subunit